MADPQLMMRRPHLRDLPETPAPEGYEVRCFRPGDEAGWNALMDRAFERPVGRSDFAREMAADRPYRPERVKLVLHGDRVVATASCWLDARYGDDAAVLHWVASDDRHGGRGLGTLVSVAALQQGRHEGRALAFLLTDDFRTAALKTYLRLDFEPVVSHRSHRRRWKKILSDLDWPQRFDEVLTGPQERFDKP